MKNTVLAAVIAAALTLPYRAEARALTIVTKLNRFGGWSGAYVVLYLLGPGNKYEKTIWMAGRHHWIYHELSAWDRANHGNWRGVDGVTGASVGSGQTLTVHTHISDALINAGYSIAVDSKAYGRPAREDVRIPLTTKNSGRLVHTHGYVREFYYRM
ncbi:DUF2271 domain-containing protein [Solirhodobacter olei]|uniref:DUF2271 domain-containing protein n=1 Tax=Solirhodobacter olei TaxID=2493082 RepID=UPI000FDB922D|nr:DUF2271 domain-containing protein [Solirhodobacter olei]